MTTLKGYFLLPFLIFASLACAPKKTLFLADGVIKNTSNASFSVVPFNQKWTPDATTKRMYSQEIEVFFQALPPAFSSNTPNRVTVLKPDLELTESSFTKKTFTNERLELTINIPSNILLEQSNERYIYFLEGYKFQLLQKAGERLSYAYQPSEATLALQFETEYFLYDKRRSEVVAWGKVSDESDIQGRPTFADYLSVLTKVSQQIIEESPFLIY